MRCSLAVVLAALTLLGAAAPPSPAVLGIAPIVAPYAASGRFWGAIEVVQHGRVAYRAAYGLADAAWSVPNTPDTVFEIASLTKQFTGAAILQLAQSGKLRVDDPVSRYYPDAPPSWDRITVRNLANHTSGLPNNEIKDFSKGLTAAYTPEELIRTFRDRPVVAAPGTRWAYTNTEYYLLAYIIERVSGESYADYLRSHLFARARMRHSTFGSTLAVVPRSAEGYAREGKGIRLRDPFDRSLEIGAGGMQTTVDDLVAWNQALDGDILLSAESRALMFAPSSPGSYGFGWFVDPKSDRDWHEGSDPGFAAFEIRHPRRRDVIVVLANLEDAPVREIAEKVESALAHLRP